MKPSATPEPVKAAPVYHAFYSASQLMHIGSSFWQHEDGSAVELTEAAHEKSSNWPDAEYRGIVTKWLRRGQPKQERQFRL